MKEKIKNIYGAHPISWTLGILAFVAIVCALIYYAPAFSLKAADVPHPESISTAVGEEIAIGGTVTVAQQNGRTLTLDTENLILTLTDDATGLSWSSAMAGAAADDLASRALLELTFRGEDNKETVWNSYENCVAFQTYRMFHIENGVRIEMNVNEGNSKVYLEYLPPRFPTERYENFILPGVDKLLEDGTIDAKQHQRYLDMLNQCYRKNPTAGVESYDQFFSGVSPAPSLRDGLINLTGLIGYTREMLIEDCAAFGTTPTFHEPAQFDLAVEFTLDNGDLIARIPTGEITAGNTFYKMQRIALLPNFVAEAASAENDGYFLAPDGSGALMRFNTFVGSMTKYDRPFMDNNYYADYYFMSEYAEELRMPLFGVINGVEPATHGMLAIIENGEDTANLHITLGSKSGSGKKATYTGTNKAYVSVDTLEHASVKIKGPYASSSPTYVADSGHIAVDFTVRYKPYTSEVSYFDMAMDYRDYLSAATGVEVSTPEGPTTYVEVLGAVTLVDRIAGIPHDVTTSMSTYADVQAIIEALPEGSVVQYDGMFNGGVASELNDGARLIKQNGTAQELQSLLETAAAKNTRLYCQVNLSRVYDGGRTYVPYFHALRGFNNQAAEIYAYRPDDGQFHNAWKQSYTRLSPKYLPYVTEKFLTDLQAQGLTLNLAIGDLGHDVFADYRYNSVINAVEANLIVEDTLNTLHSSAALTLNDPLSNVAPMADYIVNVSRTSSEYASFYCTVPFRQLALTGLTEVVGRDVNLHSRSLSYYLMQSAELGMSVKYTVSAKNPDILKSSAYEGYYAINWESWKDEILQASQQLADLRAVIGGQQIVNHEMLDKDIFQTTYANGVKVITNYTALPYESANGCVDAESYLLIQEGGAL